MLLRKMNVLKWRKKEADSHRGRDEAKIAEAHNDYNSDDRDFNKFKMRRKRRKKHYAKLFSIISIKTVER